MPTNKDVMKQALDAMLNFPSDISNEMFEAMKVLKAQLAQPDATINGMPAYEGPLSKSQRLAQPEPEPEELGEIIPADEEQLKRIAKLVGQHPLWIRNEAGELQLHAPPQREWQGLTNEERLTLWNGIECDLECLKPAQYARAIEAKLKEKNG